MASVVVVETDDVFLNLAKDRLAAAGHEVLGFADWVDVLDLLDTDYSVDAFVVDLHMPPGTPNGHALGLMAGAKRPSLKVIYMTTDPGLAVLMRHTLPNVLIRCDDAALVVHAVDRALTA